jgi:hypothetical protein
MIRNEKNRGAVPDSVRRRVFCMKKLRTFLVLSLVAFAVSCASVYVDYDYDPGYDFSKLRTYDWLPIPDKARVNELTIKNIQYFADQQLAAKGLRRSSGDPDFLIAIHGTKEQRVDVQEYGYAYGSGFYGRPRGGYPGRTGPRHAEYRRGVDVYEYQVGTLVMDFVDAEKKELIWRGTATGETDTRFSREDIQMAVTKILENFPPK